MLVRVVISGSDAERHVSIEGVEAPDHRFDVRGRQHRWPSASDDVDLDPIITNVVARTPHPGDAVELGRALFRALIGDRTWQEVLSSQAARGADHIELRLRWDPADRVMNVQHWELLHDGTEFLSVSARRVAIVREVVVEPDRRPMRPWDRSDGPPRVLFAVGSDLHDATIRPAAEFLALFRELGRASDHLPRIRFLESASVELLERAIADFAPHAVHIVAHGDVGADGPYVQLRADDGLGSAEINADQLAPALLKASPPPMVVLSACRTARGADRAESFGVEIAPMASQLVAAGMPAVIGMSGDVTDRTCRLFARRFGASLVNGDCLTLAASDARRAAFQNQGGAPPDTSVDWALPSLFVPDDMPAAFAPVRSSAPRSTRERIETDYGIAIRSQHHPVFAGRIGHIEAFAKLLGPGEPGALLLHGTPKVGLKRLRDELIILAISEGCPVVRVPLSGGGASYPQNFAAALLTILVNTDRTRTAYGSPLVLPIGGGTEFVVASRLGARISEIIDPAIDYPATADDTISFVNWTKRIEHESPTTFDGYEGALVRALIEDLTEMLTELVSVSPDSVTGPLVIDLPDLNKWGGATAGVIEHLLRPALMLDAEVPDARIRFLVTHRDERSETDEPGRRLREQAGARVEVLAVEPFTADEERLAIPWVLLHPYGDWTRVIVPSRDVDWYGKYRSTRALIEDVVDQPLPSSPFFFAERAFARAIEHLVSEQHLRSDEVSEAALLAALGGGR